MENSARARYPGQGLLMETQLESSSVGMAHLMKKGEKMRLQSGTLCLRANGTMRTAKQHDQNHVCLARPVKQHIPN